MASPLASLLAQDSVSGASPAPFRATVAPTDVEKAYSDYNNAMMQAYAAQVGQQNALYGGLATLGGAGLLGLTGGAGGLGSLLGIGGGIGGSGLNAATVNAIGGMDASAVPDSLANAYGKALNLVP